MNKLDALRLSERMDEEGVSEEEMLEDENKKKKENYKDKYKEFYSDIKLSVKEDW